VNGQKLSLREGLTELAFGAAWCRPCEREVTGLRQRAGRYGGRGYRVVLVGVEARQSKEQFVEWARGAGVRGPLVYDGDGSLEKSFGARSLPWFIVLDASGRVLHSAELPPEEEQLRAWTSGSRR
jgi:peroxiredoxin